MPKEKEIVSIPDERIVQRIYIIRGKKVMFDSDLAELYGVETKVLNQAVKRNKDRFPEDFMFQLNKQEAAAFLTHRFGLDKATFSRSQIVTLKRGQNIKYHPYVFTEQGVAMLSAVLKSKRAVMVSIQIVRTFVQLREMLATHKDLCDKIEKMERRYDRQLKVVFDVIKRFLKNDPRDIETKVIGFRDKE